MKSNKRGIWFWLAVGFGLSLFILPTQCSIWCAHLIDEIEKAKHYAYWWRRYRLWRWMGYYDRKNLIYLFYWRWLAKGTY